MLVLLLRATFVFTIAMALFLLFSRGTMAFFILALAFFMAFFILKYRTHVKTVLMMIVFAGIFMAMLAGLLHWIMFGITSSRADPNL